MPARLGVFCRKGCIQTYNSADITGRTTKGGYTDHIVVATFVLKVPQGMDVTARAVAVRRHHHLSPLRQYKVGPGKKMA